MEKAQKIKLPKAASVAWSQVSIKPTNPLEMHNEIEHLAQQMLVTACYAAEAEDQNQTDFLVKCLLRFRGKVLNLKPKCTATFSLSEPELVKKGKK